MNQDDALSARNGLMINKSPAAVIDRLCFGGCKLLPIRHLNGTPLQHPSFCTAPTAKIITD